MDAVASLPGATAEPRSLDVNVRLPDGRLLIGTVPGVRDGIIVRCVYSRLAPKHRLAAWVRFLALSAAWPERAVASVLVGRGRTQPGGRQLIRTSVIPPLAPRDKVDTALAGLGVLADLFDRGMREPVPIYCDTSAAWAEACRQGGDPVEASTGAWKSSYEFGREDAEPGTPAGPGWGTGLRRGVAGAAGPRRTRPRMGGIGGQPLRLSGPAVVGWHSRPRADAGAMMDIAPAPFDPCGPLPGPGVTVLEASAGTGKTYTIAALTSRFVASGVPLEHILAVTFTRIATAELRDRVRDRMVSAEAGLGRYVDAGVPPPPEDRVARLLAEGPPGEVSERRRLLSDALAMFDAATITTTHGFCHLVLAGLGVAGRVGVGATLVEDASDTVDEVVDDLFLRRVLGWGVPPFDRKTAHEIARIAVANPVTPLEPAPGETTPGRQRRLAEGVRREVARRLVDRNLLTYDDLLVRLKDTLSDPERGEEACRLLRDRYRVVLVDEFQDTDPVQWEVVRRAFGDGHTTLVLIGDPKQAIYAFRGADVYAYLDAARLAGSRFTLAENWRSDEGLLAAYDALLDPLHVGHPDIAYRTVAATAAHRRPGLLGGPTDTPLRARVLHARDGLVRRTKNGVQKDAALEWVARDVAADIVGLLSSRPRLVRWRDDEVGAARVLSPGDIGVLVRTNRQAGLVQEALRAVGVPAVVGGTESVFGSPSARHWLRLLEALEQPASRPRAVAVALTPFVGLTADDVVAADEATWEAVHARLHRWAGILRQRGVATATRAIAATEGLPARLLVASHRRTRSDRPRPHRRVVACGSVHRASSDPLPCGPG